MKRQTQPDQYTCLPTSFAMILDVDLEDIFKYLGRKTGPFHIQEMVNYAYFICQVPVIYIEATMELEGVQTVDDRINLRKYLEETNGIICGQFNGRSHAAAWWNNKIFDPMGTVYDLDENIILESYCACM